MILCSQLLVSGCMTPLSRTHTSDSHPHPILLLDARSTSPTWIPPLSPPLEPFLDCLPPWMLVRTLPPGSAHPLAPLSPSCPGSAFGFASLSLQSIRVWHVIQNPKQIHEWYFPAAAIKSISQFKRDARAVFLYVHENAEDFNIFFPSYIQKLR